MASGATMPSVVPEARNLFLSWASACVPSLGPCPHSSTHGSFSALRMQKSPAAAAAETDELSGFLGWAEMRDGLSAIYQHAPSSNRLAAAARLRPPQSLSTGRARALAEATADDCFASAGLVVPRTRGTLAFERSAVASRLVPCLHAAAPPWFA